MNKTKRIWIYDRGKSPVKSYFAIKDNKKACNNTGLQKVPSF